MSKFITVETGEGLTVLNVRHIVAANRSQANKENTLIEMTGGRLIMSTTTFKALTDMLKES